MTDTFTIDFDQVVGDLAVDHRAKAALRALIGAGSSATDAICRGLAHPDPRVRAGCCDVLDHHLDEAAIPKLVAALKDSDPHVRARALHALACDKCKEGACKPAEAAIVPLARAMLDGDQDPHVRVSAAQMLGPAVHRRPDVLEVLLRARENDTDPMVRKVASWHTPGGRIFEGRPSRSGRRRIGPGRV